MEKESNRLLPFLNVLIECQLDGSVLTSVFRKPTHTDKYLDFQSHHPMAHKISVIRTLYSHAREPSSTMVQRVREEERVLRVLKENGYPGSLIQRELLRSVTRLATDPPSSSVEPVARVSLLYVNHISHAIARILRNIDIMVSFHPHHTLHQHLVRVKDIIPVESRNGIIYKIPCKDCPNSYVGQTKRCLAIRLKEHQRSVYTGDRDSSALAEHALDTGHSIDWDHASVLNTCQNLKQRLCLESWHIHRHRL